MTPKIKAEFILDADGKPIQESGHYEIRLSIKDAPPDTHRVTWQLHETYYDPIRDVRDRNSGFAEVLSSYGDYEVKATVRLKDRSILATRGLAEALRDNYVGNTNPAVLGALSDIAEN